MGHRDNCTYESGVCAELYVCTISKSAWYMCILWVSGMNSEYVHIAMPVYVYRESVYM